MFSLAIIIVHDMECLMFRSFSVFFTTVDVNAVNISVYQVILVSRNENTGSRP